MKRDAEKLKFIYLQSIKDEPSQAQEIKNSIETKTKILQNIIQFGKKEVLTTEQKEQLSETSNYHEYQAYYDYYFTTFDKLFSEAVSQEVDTINDFNKYRFDSFSQTILGIIFNKLEELGQGDETDFTKVNERISDFISGLLKAGKASLIQEFLSKFYESSKDSANESLI